MAAPLKAPVLSGSAGSGSCSLSWTSVNRAVLYRVKRAVGGGAFDTVHETSGLAWVDTNVTAGTTYRYHVRAIDAQGALGPKSNEVSLVPTNPLVAPVLQGTVGDTQTSLSWSAVSGATSYTLQRKVGGGAFADLVSQAGRTYVNTGLTNGTLYTYRVRGTAGANNGPWSNEVALTPVGALEAPVLTGSAGDGENSLSWNAVAGAATYRIRRRTDGGPPVNLADTALTAYTDDSAANGTPYQYSVRGVTAGGGLGTLSNEITLTPNNVLYVGYAALAGVDGGKGGSTDTPGTYAATVSALQLGPARIVRPTGGTNFDGGGASPSFAASNKTWDGSNHSGSYKRFAPQLKGSNWIATELRLRPGDQVSGVDDADALTINPGQGSSMSRIVIDHCSLSWGPDVVLAILNRAEDITFQYCIFGPGLYTSAHSESPHSYGTNLTVPGNSNPNTEYGRRITFFRCLWIHNWGRNMKCEHVDGVEYVNCVFYNWGKELGHGNPRAANVVGNMFKRGPKTVSSNQCWEADPNYPEYPQSIYLPTTGADRNIGLGFTPTYAIGSNARRSTPYGGGLHGVTVQTPDAALAAQVVAEAGPTDVDSVDQGWKNDFTNGTGTWWYGPGKGTPNPVWP